MKSIKGIWNKILINSAYGATIDTGEYSRDGNPLYCKYCHHIIENYFNGKPIGCYNCDDEREGYLTKEELRELKLKNVLDEQ